MMILPVVFVCCIFTGINGFVFDADSQGGDFEQLKQCMMNYTSSNNQEFINCMAITNKPDPSLCSVTLNVFQCNLDYIMKTCPSCATVYKTFNYYTVRACDSTFQLPGNHQPGINASGSNVGISVFAFGLAVLASLVEIIYQ